MDQLTQAQNTELKTFFKIFFAAFIIYFFSWLVVYKLDINSLPIQSEDTLPAMFLPVTLIKEQTPYVDTYYQMLIERYPHPDDKSYEKGLTPFYLKKIQTEEGPRYISAFTLTPGLLATKIYALPIIFGADITWENLIILSHLASATIMAFAGAFLYLLLKKYFSLDEKKAILLTAAYLFGTVNFAMLSQALWQHGVVQLFTILGLLFLYAAFSEGISAKKFSISLNWCLVISGIFFGIAILTRPTALLLIPFMLLLLIEKFSQGPSVRKNITKSSKFAIFSLFFSKTKEQIKKIFDKKTNAIYVTKKAFFFLVGLIPPVLFFNWYNSQFYKDISNQGYSSQFLTSWQPTFPEGFIGMLISPSKGILIYSPIFIFAIIGFWFAIKKGAWRENFQYVVFGSIAILHILFMSIWKHWYGGFSFGYRLASDILPFLILLIIPFVISKAFEKYKVWFYAALIFSIFVQIAGIIFFDGIWHNAYDNGFKDTDWLWSIKDSEAAFNIRRVLVKIGVLERACPQCLPN